MVSRVSLPRSVSRKVRDAAAAGYILRAARAWLARRLVQRLREEELRSRSIRSIAALNVQVWCGKKEQVGDATRTTQSI